MNTKNASPRPAERGEPPTDELRTAYRVHTLVQMLTARMNAAAPWTPMVQAPFSQILH